jgi:hypothetical protein
MSRDLSASSTVSQPTASPRLQEKLISNSESKSVIVADSASYHNVQTTGTQASRPEKLKWRSGWVSLQHNIQIRHDESRAVRSHVMYKLQHGTFGNDSLFAEHGHTVIRLPPYHPS